MQRIVLRADASKKIGLGHFYRTLALANHLKGDFDCWFASYNEDENLGHPSEIQLKRILEICNPLPLGDCDDLDTYDRIFLDELNHDDVVVLDNYYFTPDYQKGIKAKGCKLVCIDDIPNKQFYCDLLITGSPLKRSDFLLRPSTIFKSGIEWFFLRDAFLKPPGIRGKKSRINNVVMAMGGSDAYNLTGKLIDVVRNVLPKAKIEVIAGDGVTIKTQGLARIGIHRNISADDIIKIYQSSDIGIVPASTVAVEALSQSLPVFVGHYVDNQKVLYNYGVNKGYFSPLGNLFNHESLIEFRMRMCLNTNQPIPQLTCFQRQKQQTIELFKNL